MRPDESLIKIMKRATAFRLFFSLAALLFVAKPFFGFETLAHRLRPHQVHTILVKSFSKRKPEGFEEANSNLEAIHKLLINPAAAVFSAISILLLTIFPTLFASGIKLTQKVLSGIRYALLPTEHSWLLTGAIII